MLDSFFSKGAQKVLYFKVEVLSSWLNILNDRMHTDVIPHYLSNDTWEARYNQNCSALHLAARPAVTPNTSFCSQLVPQAGGSYHVVWRAAGVRSVAAHSFHEYMIRAGEAQRAGTVLCQHVVRSAPTSVTVYFEPVLYRNTFSSFISQPTYF